MLKWLGRLWKTKKQRDKRRAQARWKDVFEGEHHSQPVHRGIGAYPRNLEFFQAVCGSSHDIVFRRIKAGKDEVTLIYVDGLNNKQLLEQDVIAPLIDFTGETLELDRVLTAAEIKSCGDLKQGLEQLLNGEVLAVCDKAPWLWVLGMRMPPTRSVGETQRDGSVFGPRETFVESIRINTALLRRRVRDPNLVMEMIPIGRRSHTGTVLCFIRGLADPTIVESIIERVKAVDIDLLNDTGQLEQYMQSDILTPFPQMEYTERPDAAARALCNGRVAILCDGSPNALLAPVTFAQMMITPDDRYKAWGVSTLERIVRWVALAVACMAPSLYVAIVSVHPGVMPARLELVSAANRINIPFTAAMEVFLLEFAIELLREASIRMPKSISQTLGIVGGIIIGDAAIKAGLVNPLLVVVVGVTAICSFALPSYSMASAIRVVKVFILLSTCLLGLLGFSMSLMAVLAHMCMLSSFDVDYMQPMAPGLGAESRKVIWQMPLRWNQKRPAAYRPMDTVQQKEDEP